jgi:hypothetical protein
MGKQGSLAARSEQIDEKRKGPMQTHAMKETFSQPLNKGLTSTL